MTILLSVDGNEITLKDWCEDESKFDSEFEGVRAVTSLPPLDQKFFDSLTPSQKALADEVNTRWSLTALWVLYGENRYSIYPFSVPLYRERVNQMKPWYLWQQSFYELLSLIWAYPPSRTKHPLVLFAEYIYEERENDLAAIAAGAECRALSEAKTKSRQFLKDWSLWLEDKRHKEGKPIGDSVLAQVLRGADLLRKKNQKRDRKHPLIKQYIQSGRAWWTYAERNQIVRPFAFNETTVSTRKGKGYLELKRFPKGQGNG
jgi:hypothetical protein